MTRLSWAKVLGAPAANALLSKAATALLVSGPKVAEPPPRTVLAVASELAHGEPVYVGQ